MIERKVDPGTYLGPGLGSGLGPGLGSALGPGLSAGPRAGVLLHPTSLPGRDGLGDLGPDGYRFLDWLATRGFSLSLIHI